MSSGHRIRLKTFRVKPGKKGQPILEEIASYGKNVSARIREKKSTKQTVVRRTP